MGRADGHLGLLSRIELFEERSRATRPHVLIGERANKHFFAGLHRTKMLEDFCIVGMAFRI